VRILSLFDGMGCAYLAFKRAGIAVDRYYASEIDKYAKSVAKHNIPEYVDLGDINKIDFSKLKDIDFIIGGSPCQDLSIAKKGREGLKGSRSSLFYKFVEALEIIKPKYYILENVSSMSVENINTISFILGSNPTEINSALVSAQNRKRLYWTNSFWQIPQPKDKGILLKDILEKETDKKYFLSDKIIKTFSKPSGKNDSYKPMEVKNPNGKACTLTARYFKMGRGDNYINQIGNIGSNSQGNRVYSDNGKSVSLSANGGGLGAKTGLYMIQTPSVKDGVVCVNPTTEKKQTYQQDRIYNSNGKFTTLSSEIGGRNNIINENKIRKLTPIECERLQTVPDNFSKEPNISDTQRYKMIGNGFTIDVIAHIISHLTK